MEEAGGDESVEMERRQLAADPESGHRVIAADGSSDASDQVVEGAARRLRERGDRVDGVVEVVGGP